MATALWESNRIAMSNEYKENLVKNYNSQVFSLDFTNTANSVEKINDWVKSATNNHITSIVEPGITYIFKFYVPQIYFDNFKTKFT